MVYYNINKEYYMTYDPMAQPLAITLSSDSIMRLLPSFAQQYNMIRMQPFQNAINQ